MEEHLQKLEALSIAPVGATERLSAIKELQRRSDWTGVETQSKSLADFLAKSVPSKFEERRQHTAEALGRLSGIGISIPSQVSEELQALAQPPPDQNWGAWVSRLVRVEEALHTAEVGHVTRVRERALRVAQWAGLPPPRLTEFGRRLEEASRPATEGGLAQSLDGIAALVREGLPEAAEHRRVIRETATTLLAYAREQGASVTRLEAALATGSEANPETWPDTVPAIEQAVAEVGEALRGRCSQALEALRSSLAPAAEYGVDPSAARQTIDEALARLETAPVLEIAPIFLEARRSAEEPVVAVIAGLLDEVRPRIAEARQLGRDPSDVFASMNRAREALRLKIYSEAFAASQEALDRVTKLTGDLETVREEFQTVEEMVGRFSKVGFARDPFEPALARIRVALERTQVEVARDQLKETVLQLGREALQFFGARWSQIDKLREYARERGFLPAGADQAVSEARTRLDQGDIGEAAERIAAGEVELRVAAAPFIARRVEEMEKGLRDIPDEALTAPVRRLLADADVSLRVKEDLTAAVESLRRAERDFAAVFAAHASALVEGLETEGRILESMGGPSDEIQRQIDEVQQIFNMGDFVKASRASQEIRTRAQQQQLVRGEEAVSHAKLSLVELETIGLDLAKFRTQLDDAQTAAHAGRYLEAYQRATKLEELATRTHAAAQQILEGLARAQETLGRLRDAGVDPTPFHEGLRTARLAFQDLGFDAAQTALETVQQRLSNEEARVETMRLVTETEQLIEDGRRLSLTMEPFTVRLKQLRTEQATAPPDATRTGIRALHEELIAVLRPVLEENLRALDRDLDIARSAGVNVERILAPLSEARRRITLPLPMGAAELLDSARAEFVSTRGFVEHAERMAMRAREALSQADLLHVDSVPLRNGMEKVEQLLAQRQYARVVELAGPLERELLQATYQHVSKTLAGFQATVTRLRHGGTDTALAENLLNRSRAALDEGRPVEALQLASKSEAELERAELQLHLAQGSIEAVGGAISRATTGGLVASIASEEFDAAKSAFQRHAYPDVLEHAISALDALGLAREGHRRAREAVQAAEQQIAEAVQNGVAPDEGTARLAEARQYLASGQYTEAIRVAREATEVGRWAIERLFAGPLGELRRLVETGRSEGLRSELDPLDSLVSDAEASLRARDWTGVREGIRRAEGSARRIFDTVIEGRWREVESELARITSASPAEIARREEVRRQLASLRERRDFSAALDLVRSEMDLARRRRKEEFEGRMSEFKARLWVGERLGVDTTPVMQTFSEARVAIDAGHFDSAELLLARATSALEPAIRAPFDRRLKELATEMNFAQEGLHVSVGSVRQKVEQVGELDRSGRLLDAARLLLATEEDLNLRKSLHRELMNLHYLIDAALARAQERHIDTSVARALLSESVRLRETDYPAALEKAREALRRLQGEGTVPAEAPPAQAPAPSTFWPFRRPPAER